LKILRWWKFGIDFYSLHCLVVLSFEQKCQRGESGRVQKQVPHSQFEGEVVDKPKILFINIFCHQFENLHRDRFVILALSAMGFRILAC